MSLNLNTHLYVEHIKLSSCTRGKNMHHNFTWFIKLRIKYSPTRSLFICSLFKIQCVLNIKVYICNRIQLFFSQHGMYRMWICILKCYLSLSFDKCEFLFMDVAKLI